MRRGARDERGDASASACTCVRISRVREQFLMLIRLSLRHFWSWHFLSRRVGGGRAIAAILITFDYVREIFSSFRFSMTRRDAFTPQCVEKDENAFRSSSPSMETVAREGEKKIECGFHCLSIVASEKLLKTMIYELLPLPSLPECANSQLLFSFSSRD